MDSFVTILEFHLLNSVVNRSKVTETHQKKMIYWTA